MKKLRWIGLFIIILLIGFSSCEESLPWTDIAILNGDFNTPVGDGSTFLFTSVDDWVCSDNGSTYNVSSSGGSWNGAAVISPANFDADNSLVQTLTSVYESGEYCLAVQVWGGRTETTALRSHISLNYSDGIGSVVVEEDSSSPGIGYTDGIPWIEQSFTGFVPADSPAHGKPIIIELEAEGISDNSHGSILCYRDNVSLQLR
ncbi:MAG: hypothetical protein JEY99_04340 [Spirochaetales bacterium]|nr:hypothetical protein [Spirochaetales bacterium]